MIKLVIALALMALVIVEGGPTVCETLYCKGTPRNVVCGTDGHTYYNMCWLLKRRCNNKPKLTALYEGACADYQELIPRPEERQPVARFKPIDCSTFEDRLGGFSAPCPRILNTQCANDLQNYANKCKMCQSGKVGLNIRHKGKCTDYELALAGQSYETRRRREISPLSFPIEPNCRDATIPDPRTYGQWVCGSDGVTYSGVRALCNARWEAISNGRTFNVKITKLGGIC